MNVDREQLAAPCVGLMQPTYLPWQGYFALIAAADVFVLLDDFQFRRRSFHQRNRLLQADGSEIWISVPVAHTGTDHVALSAAVPQIDAEWRRRFKATLDHGYGRAAFHDALRPEIDAWIDTEYPDLAALNQAFIEWATRTMGFTTELRRSSAIGSEGKRSWRLLDLLHRVGASTYLCARGSFDYMLDDGVFPVDGVDVVLQDYEPVAYPQRKPDAFVSHLSILDALFEVGPDATRALVLEGQRAWIPWSSAIADATRTAP